ncbi:PaaI family thioesterase [Chitinimonas koreensis]|uniref:PaaI family thioesterase n=1 Tax=Chitinimonas koreensis TaxID=356302 RepID=UPI00041A93EF|nr:PaaI family thioesterase [Chitinimonas koreensis]QNM98171.1 PaaI family thioesterase [Chitinimonas koreensis]
MQDLPLPVRNPALFEDVARWFCQIPHSATIGLEFVNGWRGQATLRVPYNTALVGNPRTGVLHGGVITSLIDTTSALSVFSMLDEREAIATLDLRIDYLRGATPGETVYCTAECYRLGRQIAFTRATAYQEGNDQPIAHGVGTFMRDSSPAQLGSRQVLPAEAPKEV